LSTEESSKKDPVPEPVNTITVPLSEEYSNEIAEEHMRRMKDLAPQESYPIDIDGKVITFKRRKIRSAERVKLEAIRQELQDSLTDNKKSYPKLEDRLYKEMSKYYLIDPQTGKGMTEAQFDGTEFEEIKQILNACAFRTERPIPSPAPLEK
jgi:hypothetical protein